MYSLNYRHILWTLLVEETELQVSSLTRECILTYKHWFKISQSSSLNQIQSFSNRELIDIIMALFPGYILSIDLISQTNAHVCTTRYWQCIVTQWMLSCCCFTLLRRHFAQRHQILREFSHCTNISQYDNQFDEAWRCFDRLLSWQANSTTQINTDQYAARCIH